MFVPPGKPKALEASQMNESFLGSSLSYEDAIENVFAWKNQTLAGHETINRVDCVVLESKPGEGDHSNYARARSWIDPRRTVPLRVEKYLASGKLARRIDTTRVASDQGHSVPRESDGAQRGQRRGDGTRRFTDHTRRDVFEPRLHPRRNRGACRRQSNGAMIDSPRRSRQTGFASAGSRNAIGTKLRSLASAAASAI